MSAIVVQGWLGCRKGGFRSEYVLCVYLRTQHGYAEDSCTPIVLYD